MWSFLPSVLPTTWLWRPQPIRPGKFAVISLAGDFYEIDFRPARCLALRVGPLLLVRSAALNNIVTFREKGNLEAIGDIHIQSPTDRHHRYRRKRRYQ